ncbi:MAG TPA: thioredoxin family protein [Gammaproteobacteria bacterium]|nr:thioredoxin family protein [Gammaproteobacteria bacterium]
MWDWIMNKYLPASLILCVGAVMAAPMPYDETADAKASVTQAITQAREDNKKVLLIFGANWCPDCRELAKALEGRSGDLLGEKFIVVKIDVGNFDKNLELVNAYGNPIKGGIPAAVVLTPENAIVYSTKAGELANARNMGEDGIYDFLRQKVVNQE